MPRYLAVDPGTKRIGVAVCDALEFGAYPLLTLHRSKRLGHDIDELVRIALKEQVVGIVVGLPLNADGSHGPSAEAATAFGNALRKRTALPVIHHDEYHTTADAEAELIAQDVSRQRRRAVIDQMAAVHLLEAFLKARRDP